MLTNILNTLAITVSLGTNLMMAKPQQQKNQTRATEHYSENINVEEENLLAAGSYQTTVGIITADNIEFRARYDYTNTHFTASVVCSMTIQRVRFGGNNPYYAVIGRATNKLDHCEPEEPYTVLQKMICIKLKPTQNTTNAELNIEDTYYKLNETYTPEHEPTGIYTMLYTSTNKNLDRLFDTTQTQSNWWWQNYNNYDAYMNMVYTYGGYTGTIEYEFINMTENGEYGESVYTKEIALQNGTNNYYIYYEEPRVIYNGESGDIVSLVQDANYTDYLSDIIIEINADGYTGAPTTTEVVDIPGTMIYVLGMPFTFISTAFNLTIFPGTPYQINLSMLFLSIIAILVFVFLLKVILNAVGKQ